MQPSTPSPPSRAPAQPAMPTTPANWAAPAVTTPHSKRRREDSLEADDYLSDLSSEGERELCTIADSATKSSDMAPSSQPHSPTPVRTRTVAGLPTPQTNRPSANLGTRADSSPLKRQRVLDSSPTRASSSRLQPALQVDSARTPAGPSDQGLRPRETAEIAGILKLLETHHSPPVVRNTVSETLGAFAERISSATAKEKMAQAALDMRNERISKLQDRVVALENALREQKEVRSNLRGRLLNLYQDT